MADASPIVRVAAGLLTRSDRVLICQRRGDGLHPLKWEFPGGKIEDGEDEAACLRRELREELGIQATPGAVLSRTTHTYPNGRHVAVSFMHVRAYRGQPVNKVFRNVVWAPRVRLLDYDFLEGNENFVTRLVRCAWPQIFGDDQAL